jgi:uncharacterized pyridoxal phosphate-containing UPF0001 family protein
VDDQLATRYAALQQRLTAAVDIRASRLMGASPPSPLPSGSPEATHGLLQAPSPLLIGASKGQPTAKLEAAIGLGLRHFGENKVQEAAEKWPAIKARHPEVTLHLIGPLQSNKAADAVALFDVIQTVDRPKIAEALAKEIERARRQSEPCVASHGEPQQAPAQRGGMGGSPPSRTTFATPKLLIQVNIGEEPQKAGVAPKDAAALLAHCRSLGLTIDGLMCVPPDGVNPAPYFALLAKLARELGLKELSMGMSGDFETAIRMGATMVRVGTALFGSRTP